MVKTYQRMWNIKDKLNISSQTNMNQINHVFILMSNLLICEESYAHA